MGRVALSPAGPRRSGVTAGLGPGRVGPKPPPARARRPPQRGPPRVGGLWRGCTGSRARVRRARVSRSGKAGCSGGGRHGGAVGFLHDGNFPKARTSRKRPARFHDLRPAGQPRPCAGSLRPRRVTSVSSRIRAPRRVWRRRVPGRGGPGRSAGEEFPAEGVVRRRYRGWTASWFSACR